MSGKKGVPCHQANVSMAPIYEMTVISLHPLTMVANASEFRIRDGRPGDVRMSRGDHRQGR